MVDAELVSILEKATLKVSVAMGLADARFALYPAARVDMDALIDALKVGLFPLSPKVELFSPSERGVLMLTLPGRALLRLPGPVFDAAYALAERFGLDVAEPEIQASLYPGDVPGQSDQLEGMDFTKYCFAESDPRLNEKKTWALHAANVINAWEYSESLQRDAKGKGILIAQPDTGVTSHPVLAQVHFVDGIDLVDDKPEGVDPLGYDGNPSHGTGTASVVVSPDGGELIGSAPAASHMPIRAIESVVRISQFRVAEAIDYAVEKGAHVITMSLGGIPSLVLWRALQRAIRKNVIVLAAAGNCAKVVVWPARYADCIAVAGVNIDDQPWRGTCSGPDVDIAAPAENVFRARTERKDGSLSYVVEQGQGTSFAVALTAGIAANWLAHHGRAHVIAEAEKRGESVQSLFRRLLRTTARRPDLWDERNMGAGIVDALALLQASFDAGQQEGFGMAAPELPSSSIRTLAQEVGTVAAPGDINLERYGAEIALAILEAQRDKLSSATLRPTAQENTQPGSLSGRTSSRLRQASTHSPVLAGLLGR